MAGETVFVFALIGVAGQYADVLWSKPDPQERATLVSTIKVRHHGFHDCIDSSDSVIELLEQMRRARYIP